MSYLEDFKKRVESNNYTSLLKLWEEYCYAEEPQPDELIKILELIKNSDLATPFGKHVERAIPLWREVIDTKKSNEIIKLIFDLQNSNSDELAETAYIYLKDTYIEDQRFEDKIRLIGLRGKENFQGAISKYELLTHIDRGKFVFHTAGWGTGEILDYSLVREEITLEFDFVVGQIHLSFENAMKTLIPLADEHFLARRFGNPDLFEKEAKKDPIMLIHTLLKDLGPKTAAEIKEEVCGLIIPEKDWSKWWQAARAKIKKNTMIESPQKPRDPFRLREEGISHEESFYKSLETKATPNIILQLVHSFIRDFPQSLKNKEFASILQKKLTNVISTEKLTEAQKLQFYFLLEDLLPQKEELEIDKMIKNFKFIFKIIDEIEIVPFKKRTLAKVQKLKDNWQDIFLSLFFSIPQNTLRDYILYELIDHQAKDKLKLKLKELLLHPLEYPSCFVWFFQKIIEKPSNLPYSDIQGQKKFFEGLLILLDSLHQKPELRDLAKKISNLLTSDRYSIVRYIMKNASLEEAKEYLLLTTKCHLLPNHDIKIIHSLAEVEHPSLRQFSQEEKEEDIIWTTEEGLKKAIDRMEQIATVEILENAKEIEEAREHGDLRENAEYKAAIEQRERLQEELKLLSAQINKSKIINKKDITADSVGIGNVIEVINKKNKKSKFTLLGPWDAIPEENILSFQSKVAQAMIGLKIGDSFSLQDEEYTITAITNYFR